MNTEELLEFAIANLKRIESGTPNARVIAGCALWHISKQGRYLAGRVVTPSTGEKNGDDR